MAHWKLSALIMQKHDIRFVEDNWAQPAISAWGLGWEVWLDGLEITQFTYFQQVGGISLDTDCRRTDLWAGTHRHGFARGARFQRHPLEPEHELRRCATCKMNRKPASTLSNWPMSIAYARSSTCTKPKPNSPLNIIRCCPRMTTS